MTFLYFCLKNIHLNIQHRLGYCHVRERERISNFSKIRRDPKLAKIWPGLSMGQKLILGGTLAAEILTGFSKGLRLKLEPKANGMALSFPEFVVNLGKF